MESVLILDCSDYSENIVDVIKMFQQIGWDIYNLQGEVEYLPVGDIDDYNWQAEKISEINLYDIISEKIAIEEQVGVNLFCNGVEGISFLAYSTDDIMLSIHINRRTVKERYTDTAWYIENIIYRLLNAGVKIFSYEIKEYSD